MISLLDSGFFQTARSPAIKPANKIKPNRPGVPPSLFTKTIIPKRKKNAIKIPIVTIIFDIFFKVWLDLKFRFSFVFTLWFSSIKDFYFDVGFFSALFGVGGGSFSVPFMNAMGYSIKKSVATASLLGFVISVPAAINYMFAGRDVGYYPGVINVGYVSFLCVVAILPTSICASYLGGRLVHNIPERLTKNIFACLLIVVGIKMFISEI